MTIINNVQFQFKWYPRRAYPYKGEIVVTQKRCFSLLIAFQTAKRTYGWGISQRANYTRKKFYHKYVGKFPAKWVYRHIFWHFYFMICYKDQLPDRTKNE